MGLVDVQVRRLLPAILADVGKMIQEIEKLPEHSPTRFWVINPNRALVDEETGQQFYAVVYALLTESEEEAKAAAEALGRVHGV